MCSPLSLTITPVLLVPAISLTTTPLGHSIALVQLVPQLALILGSQLH